MSSSPGNGKIDFSIATASGYTIEYNVLLEGLPDRPLVVLAHALMADLRMWDSTVIALHQAGFRTLRYDYVGHGSTQDWTAPKDETGGQATNTPFLFDEFSQHMREIVLRATGEDQVYAVLGCSMGGVLALRYAMLYPQSVSYVVSCDAPGIKSLAKAKPLWQERVAEFHQKGVNELAQRTVDRWFSDPCSVAIKEAALMQARSCTFQGYSICAHAIQNYAYESDLEKIKAKTMILAGDKDSSIGPPEILQKVAQGIKNARYVQIKDSGHLPPMHQPEEFERVLVEFLRRDQHDDDI